MSLLIGSVSIPQIAALDLDQQYQPIGGEAILRACSGRGIKQMTYQRLRITTSGSGWLPAGLAELDFTAQHVLGCVVPRGVPAVFATRQATLPAARRSDSGFTPFATALLPGGQAMSTPVSLAGNVATCTAVTDAVAYRVNYYPAPTVWLMRPSESGSQSDASYRWELIAEEV